MFDQKLASLNEKRKIAVQLGQLVMKCKVTTKDYKKKDNQNGKSSESGRINQSWPMWYSTRVALQSIGKVACYEQHIELSEFGSDYDERNPPFTIKDCSSSDPKDGNKNEFPMLNLQDGTHYMRSKGSI